MSEIILSVEHLTKKFPVSGGKFLTACDDITFNVRKGETVAIVGESGCGKTTLLKTIMNMQPPTLADNLMVMSQGRVVEYGKTDDVINRPQNDYTKTLLASVPEIGGRRYV